MAYLIKQGMGQYNFPEMTFVQLSLFYNTRFDFCLPMFDITVASGVRCVGGGGLYNVTNTDINNLAVNKFGDRT